MPVQKCSLLSSIKLYSDDLEGGEYFVDSRFAPSLCRSISTESGREVLWGRAEEELKYTVALQVRKMLGRNLLLSNIRIHWKGDEALDSYGEEEENVPRRTDYRAVYLQGRELKSAIYFRDKGEGAFSEHCKIETSDAEGSYLVCRKISIEDWDRLMVGILIRGLPFSRP